MNCWLLFGTMLSSALLAQQTTNAPPTPPLQTPAPAVTNAPGVTNAAAPKAPAAKAGKKQTAPKQKAPVKKKDAAAELRTVPLVPGPAVVEANNVNVRGQAKLKSEVVTRLKKGDTVTVIEEITRNNSGPDEPSAWAKIVLPAGAHVWVNARFIDPTTKTVTPKKLNLRSGPGENYSVVGLLQKGEIVKELTAKGDWTEIEAPTNAYAFMAAQYLKQEASAAPPAPVLAAAPATAPTEAAPAPTTVAEPPPIAAANTNLPVAAAPAETAAGTNAPTEPAAGAVEPSTIEPTPVVTEEPPPKRIVQREGFVRGTVSIQAPTPFALVSPDNGKLMDYLYTTSPNLDLRRYKGLRIVVTGEEGLDDRWGNTPIITIQKIQVVE